MSDNGKESIYPTPPDAFTGGLTKREYFAAMAMQGLLSIYDPTNETVPTQKNVEYMVGLSVTAADELLKQLSV